MPAEVRFLSLFVDDLEGATARLTALLGCAPRPVAEHAIAQHPFAGDGPVVFAAGAVEIALYRASAARGTHRGDLGVGVVTDEDASTLSARVASARALPLSPPSVVDEGRSLQVARTPDGHFFELIGRAPPASRT